MHRSAFVALPVYRFAPRMAVAVVGDEAARCDQHMGADAQLQSDVQFGPETEEGLSAQTEPGILVDDLDVHPMLDLIRESACRRHGRSITQPRPTRDLAPASVAPPVDDDWRRWSAAVSPKMLDVVDDGDDTATRMKLRLTISW